MLKTPIKIFKIARCINCQGLICTSIKMSGCNFYSKPCSWCNEKQLLKLSSGESMTIRDILNKVKKIGCQNIIITGGEPLYQKGAINDLIISLSEFGYNISLETNGSRIIDDDVIDYLDCIIADYKLSSTGIEENEMNIDLFKRLRVQDFIKMVINGSLDLEEAVKVYRSLKKNTNVNFIFSPVIDSIIDTKDIYNFLIKHNVMNVIIK